MGGFPTAVFGESPRRFAASSSFRLPVSILAFRHSPAIPARATNPRHGGVSKKVLRRLSGRFRHNRAVSDGLDGTMARNAASRKELSAAGLLGIVRRCFEAVADPVARRGGASLADCLMSGLAVYGLKYASLLKFDEAARGDDAVRSNLRRLYGVARVPSDTRMRERLDGVDPQVAAVLLPALVRGAAAGQGSGGVRLPGRALPAVGGRHGAPLVEEGALRELLREAPPGRHDDVLPHDAGGGAGASGGARGVPAGAGADREDGRRRTTARRKRAEARRRSGCSGMFGGSIRT